MLLWLLHYLSRYVHWFRVFDYLTFRAILSALTSLTCALCIGPKVIAWLKQYQFNQPIRSDGPQSHLSKAGTPTMGGALIISTIVFSVLCWANLDNPYVYLMLLVTVGFAVIGWVDDYRKLVLKNSKGLAGKWKLFWQSLIASLAILYLYFFVITPNETILLFPFFKQAALSLGPCYLLLAYFVVVGASNAVNLTDGLDGLAILPTVLVAGALGIFAYLTGNHVFAHYLEIPYVPGVGELVIFAGAMVGSGLGFLWFNAYPAQIFMGDVGALSLGAALGLMAVMLRQEIVFFIMGGVFVMETVSVMIQVTSFRLRGKRVFKMAPIHHHFELKGWPEPRVIVRFWIITVILVLLGLATLKLR